MLASRKVRWASGGRPPACTGSAFIRGVLPFLAAETAILFLLTVFPQLVTVPARWLY